ncbi:MAG: hypothetical protein AABW48_02220 [Nanoarchaeota archaeon]
MAIILPGYETLLQNQFYTKDSVIDPNIPNGKPLPAKELIWLSTYTLPFEEEVINYLQQKVQKIESLVGSQTKLSQLSLLEQALTNLSRDARTMIKTNQEDVIGQLMENVSFFANKDSMPQRCLQVSRGLILTELFDSINKTDDPDWHPGQLFSLTNRYGALHGRHMSLREEPVEKWVAFLTVDEDLLPKKAIINSLLKYGSAVSDHLQIQHLGAPYVNYPKPEVKRILDMVYKSLSGETINVTDISNLLLDQITLDVLEPLLFMDHKERNIQKQPIEDDDEDALPVVSLFGGNNKSGKDKPN